MNLEDKDKFSHKIRIMLSIVDGTYAPSEAVIGGYWLGLKDFSISEVTKAVDVLMVSATSHITPADIALKIKGKPKKLTESEMRSAAHAELSKPEWERIGFVSSEEYEKFNQEKWIEDEKRRNHS